ncbi:hypothetical protein [Nocardiopsis nanhaiensis]
MSARRRARAAAVSSVPLVEGVPAPAELLDPFHTVWHHQGRYRAWMSGRGWSMPAAERLGVATEAENRRRAAWAGWVREQGWPLDWSLVVVWGRF